MTEPDSVAMPAMAEAQVASWHALMELYDRLAHGWTLVGGQLVHLHCAEREVYPQRPTNDIDAVVDVRAERTMLDSFTRVLRDLGFAPVTVGEGVQHRWVREEAQIDVLIPDNVGGRAASRTGAGGARTVETPGGTQALKRTEPLRLAVNSRVGVIRRPNLVGALVVKAAAHSVLSDPNRARHREDFVQLATLVAARDFRDEVLKPADRKHLRAMVQALRSADAVADDEDTLRALSRLMRGAGLE